MWIRLWGCQPAAEPVSGTQGGVLSNEDCDDGDPMVYPEGEELPGDGVDNEYDSRVDCADDDLAHLVETSDGNVGLGNLPVRCSAEVCLAVPGTLLAPTKGSVDLADLRCVASVGAMYGWESLCSKLRWGSVMARMTDTLDATHRAVPRALLAALTVVSCTPEGSETTSTELDLGCTPIAAEVAEVDGTGILLTPADLEPYCGARTIRGSLFFASDADPNGWDGLRALGALEVFEGGFWIEGIAETIRLPRLREIGTLDLTGPAQIDPPKLPALQTAGALSIEGFRGTWDLPELRQVGRLHISDGIDAVSGLGQLEAVTEEINLTSGTLTTLPSAPLLTTVEGSVRLSYIRDPSLALLGATERIEGSLELSGTGLTSLSDFARLESVGAGLQGQDSGVSLKGLVVTSNTELVSLSGLDSLGTVRGSMLVDHNWNLASLDGFAVQTWESTEAGASTLLEVGSESSGDISALLGLLTAELPVPCDLYLHAYPYLGTGMTVDQWIQIQSACQGQ